jgi:hypothetical protein
MAAARDPADTVLHRLQSRADGLDAAKLGSLAGIAFGLLTGVISFRPGPAVLQWLSRRISDRRCLPVGIARHAVRVDSRCRRRLLGCARRVVR